VPQLADSIVDDAVAALVNDDDVVAMEGFSHLVPFAAARALLRLRRRRLTLVRMVPDLLADQLIGAGCLSRLLFSWAGNPGVGSLHRFRDAVENGWPRPLEIEEHTHAGLAARYQAGAAGLPFMAVHAYVGTDLTPLARHVDVVTDPFTGASASVVAPVRPDVAIIHAQRADRAGNVQMWGVQGVQREAVLASDRSLVTVEEIVEQLPEQPGSVILPAWTVTRVVHSPGGTWPSYAQGFTHRDELFYSDWNAISRDRATFLAWMVEQHLMTADQSSRQSPT
jgi:glutaconate CoA-transferase subunit A